MNINCQICLRKFKNYNSLAKHLYHSHKNITREEYYKTFVNEKSSICVCGKNKNFRNLQEGYRTYCSNSCKGKNVDYVSYWKNKKQPKNMILKRKKNTNYKKAQKTRLQTMLKRYNVDNCSKILGLIRKKRSKMPKRTKQWSQKIIKSKRKNNTLKHSLTTRKKIGESLKKVFQSPDFDKSKFLSKQTGGICGYYKNLFFRSSLELAFLVWCNKHNKSVRNASTKEFRIKLSTGGTYYPDFYIITDDVIIEIKPSSMVLLNLLKINTAKNLYGNRFKVITEKEVPYLTKHKIENLIKMKLVKLTKKSIPKFKRYHY